VEPVVGLAAGRGRPGRLPLLQLEARPTVLPVRVRFARPRRAVAGGGVRRPRGRRAV